jgi:hypothetical protein
MVPNESVVEIHKMDMNLEVVDKNLEVVDKNLEVVDKNLVAMGNRYLDLDSFNLR